MLEKICKAELSDLQDIAALESEIFSDAWSLKSLEETWNQMQPIRLEEIHTFFSNECFICSSTRNLHHALPVILLIKVKYGMLITAVPFSI